MPSKGISLIRLKNILSMPEAEIEPTELTMIVGDSNTGKSNFIRGAYAVVTARNLLGLRSAGAQECEVYLKLNGTEVLLNEDGYTVQEGRQKPWETEYQDDMAAKQVQEALGMPELALDKDLTLLPNIKKPISPPFLITEYPPAVARILSSLTGAHVTLAAYRETNRLLGNARKARAQAKRDLQAAKDQRDAYVEAPERHLAALQLQADLRDLRGRERTLEALRTDVHAFQQMFEVLSEAIRYLDETEALEIPDTDALLARWEAFEKLKADVEDLQDTERDLAAVQKALDTATKNETVTLKALNDAIKHGNPCPYTGHKLPKECAEKLVEVP